jgi:hypothetical protein
MDRPFHVFEEQRKKITQSKAAAPTQRSNTVPETTILTDQSSVADRDSLLSYDASSEEEFKKINDTENCEPLITVFDSA